MLTSFFLSTRRFIWPDILAILNKLASAQSPGPAGDRPYPDALAPPRSAPQLAPSLDDAAVHHFKKVEAG